MANSQLLVETKVSRKQSYSNSGCRALVFNKNSLISCSDFYTLEPLHSSFKTFGFVGSTVSGLS